MEPKVEIVEHGTLREVALNRPGAYNAFDLPTITLLAGTLADLAADPTCEGVLISGRGKAFCAGGDLKWALAWPGGPAAAFHRLAAQFHAAVLEIRRMNKPVAAAIHGPAAGGGFSLALACDFRIMEKDAVLRQAYTSNGLCVDGAGTWTLPRLVGPARAMEILAFDPPIPAQKALEWGLITALAENGKSRETSLEILSRVAAGSLHAFGLSKRLLNESLDTPLEAQLEKEREGLASCAAQPEGMEGLSAFAERRKPDFVEARKRKVSEWPGPDSRTRKYH
ncbi:MAG: enoyl-CoA hydratase-related protein [Pseudomonadota bacterium]